MRKLLLLLVLCISGLPIAVPQPASAQIVQMRPLPPAGKRGTLGEPLALPLVQIGWETYRLAPGAVIFDRSNRTVIQATLPAGEQIWYLLDAAGAIQRIFLLTPDEQAQLDASGSR
jgi:hypothetical protein